MTEAEWASEPDPAPLLRFADDRLTDRLRLLFMAGCCRRIWHLLTDHRFRHVVEVAERLADGAATEAELAAASEELPLPGHPLPPPPLLDPPARENWTTGRDRDLHVSGIARIDPEGRRDGGVLNFRDLPVWCQRTYHAVAAIAPRGHFTVADCCEMAAAHHAGDCFAEHHPLHGEIDRLRSDVQREYRQAEDYRWRGVSRLSDEAFAVAGQLERRTAETVQQLTNEIWSAGAAERISRATAERAAQTDLIRCLVGNPFRTVKVDPQWLTSTVIELTRGIDADQAFDLLPVLADALQDAGCDNEDLLAHCRNHPVHTKGCWVVEKLSRR